MTNSLKYQNTRSILRYIIAIDLFLFTSVLIGFSNQKDIKPEAFNYYIEFGYWLIGIFLTCGILSSCLKAMPKQIKLNVKIGRTLLVIICIFLLTSLLISCYALFGIITNDPPENLLRFCTKNGKLLGLTSLAIITSVALIRDGLEETRQTTKNRE